MSITLSDVTLADPTKEQMFETEAQDIAFSCTATAASGSTDQTTTSIVITSYGDLTYAWTFSDGETASTASGTHTFTGLEKGAAVTLTASIKVSCVKTVSTQTYVSNWYQIESKDEDGNVITDEDGNPVKEWVDGSYWADPVITTSTVEASSSASQDANTHPGTSEIFDGLAFDQIIELNLTSSMVDSWCVHCGKWLSWYEQTDNYSGADECKVNSKDWITASWYNGCVTTAKASSPSVTGGSTGTVISASYFKSLDTLVSRRE